MTKIIVIIVFLMSFKAESQNFDALPYLNNSSFYIERIFHDSIHDKLIVSSKFMDYVNGKNVRGVWSWDGMAYDSLSSGLNTHDTLNNTGNSTVMCGIPFNGKLLVGGSFQSIGGINASSLATWNGIKWDSLPVRAFKFLDFDANIYGLTKHGNKLYIYGVFDTIQGQPANGIATYDGISFQPVNVPLMPQAFITSMLLYNGELYICGNFSFTGETGNYDILKFDGTNWVSVGGGLKGGFSSASSMAIYNNELYVGGYFLKASGNVANIIMKWDGNSWHDVGWGNEYQNGGISKLLVYHSKLYAFGTFEIAANINASRVAIFDGNQWCMFSDILNSGINTAAIYNDSIYIAGNFKNINGDTTIKCIAKIKQPETYNVCVNVVSIKYLENNIHVSIYPNPTSTILNITDEQYQFQSSIIEIKNTLGQVIKSAPFQKEIDVSYLQSGMYFIEIKNSNGNSYSAKFIKQ